MSLNHAINANMNINMPINTCILNTMSSQSDGISIINVNIHKPNIKIRPKNQTKNAFFTNFFIVLNFEQDLPSL